MSAANRCTANTEVAVVWLCGFSAAAHCFRRKDVNSMASGAWRQQTLRRRQAVAGSPHRVARKRQGDGPPSCTAPEGRTRSFSVLQGGRAADAARLRAGFSRKRAEHAVDRRTRRLRGGLRRLARGCRAPGRLRAAAASVAEGREPRGARHARYRVASPLRRQRPARPPGSARHALLDRPGLRRRLPRPGGGHPAGASLSPRNTDVAAVSNSAGRGNRPASASR